MKVVTLIGFVSYVLLITSCCSMKTDGTFTQKDSGAVFNSSEGGVIEIALKSNPTTGYTWNVVEYDKSIIKLDTSSFKRDSELLGSGGTETFKFSIIGKGKADLILKYSRKWEKDVAPAEIFKLIVIAK